MANKNKTNNCREAEGKGLENDLLKVWRSTLRASAGAGQHVPARCCSC